MSPYTATLNAPNVRSELPPMPRDPNWLTTAEAAALLQVDAATVRRWADAGRLQGVRIYRPGSHRYFWRPDLEAFARRARGEDDPNK